MSDAWRRGHAALHISSTSQWSPLLSADLKSASEYSWDKMKSLFINDQFNKQNIAAGH